MSVTNCMCLGYKISYLRTFNFWYTLGYTTVYSLGMAKIEGS